MKKILTIILILSVGLVRAQQDIPASYLWYRFTYGTRIDRGWFDKAIHIPRDTIYTKSGLAIKGSSLYYGDSSRWYLAGGGVGGFNTSLGTGYKIAVDGTNNVKSILAGLNITVDSATSGSVKITNNGLFGAFGQDARVTAATINRRFSSANASSFTFDSVTTFNVAIKDVGGLFRIYSVGSTADGIIYDPSAAASLTGMFLLDKQNLNQVGFKFKGQDFGFTRNEVENTWTPTLAVAFGGGDYVSASTGFTSKLTYSGAIGQWYQAVKGNPFCDSCLMIRNSGAGIQFAADGNGYFWFKGSASNMTSVYGGFAAGGRFAIGNTSPGQKLSVTGSFSNSDSVITTGLLRATDTTGFDVDVIDRATGNHKKLYAGLIGSGGGGSGVTTMAPIGSAPNANGATISGSTLNLEPYSASFGGVTTTGAQTSAGRKTFGAQAKFDAGFSVSGSYAANEGFMIGYDAGGNMSTLISYDGGYKDIRIIGNVTTLYGGGSNPGVLINSSGNTVLGSSTAADATEKLTVIGNGKILNNSLTTGNALSVSSTSVTSGAGADISIAGTAAAGDGGFTTTQAGLRIKLSGTNATSTVPTFGINIDNAHAGTAALNYGAYVTTSNGGEGNAGYFQSSGTNAANTALNGTATGSGTSVNVAGKFNASGGNTNYAILTTGANSGFLVAAPNSALHTTSFATAYVARTTTYPITAADYTIEATSGTFTTTLPTAVGITGRQYVITNSGSGVVTLATTSSQVFQNVTATPTTLTLNQFNTVIVQSNGANWLRISSL